MAELINNGGTQELFEDPVTFNRYDTTPMRRYKGNFIPFYLELVDFEGRPSVLRLNDRNEEVLGVQLSIAPSTLSFNLAKIITRTQTMTAWVEEHWGEEIDTITLQGYTASFIYMPKSSTDEIKGGLSIQYRKDTAAYKEFKNVMDIFNTNGCLFDERPSTINSGMTGRGFVKERLYIQLTYDYACHRGYFESIDVVENATNPFRFNYTFTYKSEKTIYSWGAKYK